MNEIYLFFFFITVANEREAFQIEIFLSNETVIFLSNEAVIFILHSKCFSLISDCNKKKKSGLEMHIFFEMLLSQACVWVNIFFCPMRQ